MENHKGEALVSIGIPTFNRPDGLRRTLESLISQTYKNIEIIISDNCSDDYLVRNVIEEFKEIDHRIVSFSQRENIGAANNFKFVLANASGVYFMWATDDDGWDSNYIKELVSIIGNHSAAFCNYFVNYRSNFKKEKVDIKISATGQNRFEQAKNFLLERVPSMFYSIYKRVDILWFLKFEGIFDWFDCYSIFRVILLHEGFVISSKRLYSAGIDEETYINKPVEPSQDRVFRYRPYFNRSMSLIYKSDLTFVQKLKLYFYLFDVNIKSFISLETSRKNYRFYYFFYKIYYLLTPKVNIIRLY